MNRVTKKSYNVHINLERPTRQHNARKAVVVVLCNAIYEGKYYDMRTRDIRRKRKLVNAHKQTRTEYRNKYYLLSIEPVKMAARHT